MSDTRNPTDDIPHRIGSDLTEHLSKYIAEEEAPDDGRSRLRKMLDSMDRGWLIFGFFTWGMAFVSLGLFIKIVFFS